MDLDPDACYRALETRDARFDGRLFIGVKTTGVYCRPICPARTPRRRNVTFYPSAAAAQEAGFRACLRCRPEVSPDIAAWNGSSNTVSRALRLIEEGALDGRSVGALAERLGVGERHLRRLFRRHLGASPVSVAQTRRVLLAKQLIHDTSLPMTQVALAAGFGSVRRFNETFRALYHRPPAQLRRSTGPATAGGTVAVRLAYRPPYDWDAMAGYLIGRAVPGVEEATPHDYARTVDIDGVRGWVRVRPGQGDWLDLETFVSKLSVLPRVIARVRRVFDLAADPVVIASHLARDPVLERLVRARPGLRLPGAWDGFELGVRAILGQQISVAAARKLAGKLTESLGEELAPELGAGGHLTHAFPSPERLAAADLSCLPLPRARSRALRALASAFVANPALFGPTRDLDEAVHQLLELPGVGEWTAQYIAMRAMREPDAFPAADLGLIRALAAPDGSRPSAAALGARAERWRPWRAYAAQHLWTADAQAPRSRVATRNPPTGSRAA